MSQVTKEQGQRMQPARNFGKGEIIRVDKGEFFNLLLSRRNLLRDDSPGGEILGLLDPETGTSFVIERNELFSG
jgi:hypothetical protein